MSHPCTKAARALAVFAIAVSAVAQLTGCATKQKQASADFFSRPSGLAPVYRTGQYQPYPVAAPAPVSVSAPSADPLLGPIDAIATNGQIIEAGTVPPVRSYAPSSPAGGCGTGAPGAPQPMPVDPLMGPIDSIATTGDIISAGTPPPLPEGVELGGGSGAVYVPAPPVEDHMGEFLEWKQDYSTIGKY